MHIGKKGWTILLAVSIVIVAIILYFMITYRTELALPEFTFETILVMLVLGFPANYVSAILRNKAMGQTTQLGECYKEMLIGVITYWTLYIAELLVYNYIIFGRLMSFPSWQSISSVGLFNFLWFVPLSSIIWIKKKRKWYEKTQLTKDMESE